MKKLYYWLEGGSGDCYSRFFRQEKNPPFANIPQDCYTRLCIWSHNASTVEAFRYMPFSEICYYGWDFDNVNAQRASLKAMLKDDGYETYYAIEEKSMKYERPRIALSKWDEEYLAKVLPEKYVVFHPFAGEPTRKLEGRLKSNLPVVVIGGSSLRGNRVELWEKWEQGENEISLVNVANPRLCIEAIRRANHFVGAFSCYAWAACCQGVPNHIFWPGYEDGHTWLARPNGGNLVHWDKWKSFELTA